MYCDLANGFVTVFISEEKENNCRKQPCAIQLWVQQEVGKELAAAEAEIIKPQFIIHLWATEHQLRKLKHHSPVHKKHFSNFQALSRFVFLSETLAHQLKNKGGGEQSLMS